MSKIIKRMKYIDQILPFVDKNIIKVLVGQRRSGKSFTLLSLIKHLELNNKEYIFINKEELQRDTIKTYKELYEVSKNYKYIFIDEVQEIQEREKAVRSLWAEGKDIYITGSNSQLLSGELASGLSGRYIQIAIYPLDRTEFLDAFDLQSNKESFMLYLEYGGMPYLIRSGLNETSKLYGKDVFNTIILKDIIKRYRIRNVDIFESLIQYIAQNIGRQFSGLSISNYLSNNNIDISPKVINEYLNYCNKALFLHSISRYDVIGKKIFERQHKHYFTDVGLKHTIYPFTIKEIDRSLENIIYSNLISHNRNITTGDVHGKEIDFIAEKNNKRIYIQVSYLLEAEKTIEREFGNLANIKDNRPKYVVSMDEVIGNPIDGIIQVPVREFLNTIVKYN